MKLKIFSVIILAVTISYFSAGCTAIGDLGQIGELSDYEAVSYDRDNLNIQYTGSDSLSSVTADIVLKTEGENGTTITWVSSDPSVISIGGSVTRPANGDGDKVVTLTGTITKGSESVTKVFSLTVIEQPASDLDSVAEDKTNLAVTYGAGDSAGNVTQDVTLPTSGSNGTTISWSSSNTSYIVNNGSVTRPAFGSGDATVTLTATITKGSESDTKVFTLTVKETPQTDAEAVAEDKTNLVVTYGTGDSAGNVTQDVTLPTSGSNGTTISWSSSNTSYIANNGSVTRPLYADGNQTVTLTATITKGGESDTKTFSLTVIKQPISDSESVAADKTNLAVTYGAGDSAGSVTQSLTLPTSGANGTTISWSSSNTSYIANNGTVTRPLYAAGNQTVTLTATITKGSESDTRNFTFTVKHLPGLTPDGDDSVSPVTNIVIVFPDSFDGTTKGTVSFASPAVTFTDDVNAVITFSTTNNLNDTIIINPDADLQSTNYTGISISGFKKSDNSDVTWSDSAYYFPVRGAMDLYFPFTGGSLEDASGRGVTLVKFGDPTLTTGHDGSANGAYSFDGTGDYLQVVGDLGISAGDDFTISAWIKLDPGFLNFNAIVSNYHDNGLKALMFRVNSNWNGHINALDLAEGYSNNGVLSTGTWLHVVGVYTNSTRQVRFYVNGNDAGTGTTPYTIEDQTTKFAIGGDYLNVSPRYFKGTIDEVRFYKYALTATEVGNLYRNDDINDNTP